jgi:hypothetical protein
MGDMGKFDFNRANFLTGLFLLVGVALISISVKPFSNTTKPRTLIYAPSNMHLLAFGYDEVMADMLWIRVLQDIDACDPAALHSVEGKPGVTECKNGWAFSIISAISHLAPQFKVPIKAGAVLLSIVVRDKEGAGQIYATGVRHFPADWQIAYFAGYQAMADLDNPGLAADYLVHAADYGAPQWLRSLAAKLYTKEGRVDLAKSMLERSLSDDSTPEYRARIEETYKSILKKVEDSPDGRIHE